MKTVFFVAATCVLVGAGFLWWNLEGRRPQSAPAPLCPVIADVSPRPLGEEDFNGKIESGDSKDDFLYDREGKLRVGVREQLGAALVYFGGEQNALKDGVSVAFHDDARAFQGCAYNASCVHNKENDCTSLR